jgi:hypothetical protein
MAGMDLLSHGGCERVACLTTEIDRVRSPRRRIAGQRPRLGFQHVSQRLPQERSARPQLTAPNVFDLLCHVGPVDVAGPYADALAAMPETTDGLPPLPIQSAMPTLDELLDEA